MVSSGPSAGRWLRLLLKLGSAASLEMDSATFLLWSAAAADVEEVFLDDAEGYCDADGVCDCCCCWKTILGEDEDEGETAGVEWGRWCGYLL